MIVPPRGHRVSGADAIRAAVQPVFLLSPSVEIEVVGELPTDELAVTYARVKLHGPELEFAGRGTVVSRRQPDGSWRIVLDNPMSPE